jgi:hypothetical protein
MPSNLEHLRDAARKRLQAVQADLSRLRGREMELQQQIAALTQQIGDSVPPPPYEGEVEESLLSRLKRKVAGR